MLYRLATRRNGALIVLTRQAGLKAICDSGTLLNSEVSTELGVHFLIHIHPCTMVQQSSPTTGSLQPGVFFFSLFPTAINRRNWEHVTGLKVGISEELYAVVLIVSEERGRFHWPVTGNWFGIFPNEQMLRQVSSLMAGIGGED